MAVHTSSTMNKIHPQSDNVIWSFTVYHSCSFTAKPVLLYPILFLVSHLFTYSGFADSGFCSGDSSEQFHSWTLLFLEETSTHCLSWGGLTVVTVLIHGLVFWFVSVLPCFHCKALVAMFWEVLYKPNPFYYHYVIGMAALTTVFSSSMMWTPPHELKLPVAL